MAKNYQQLQKEIDQLQKRADALRKKELADVVKEIKDVIAYWGLSADDLGLTKAASSRAASAKKVSAKRAAKASKAKRSSADAAKYRDESGNTWGGRGPRPGWLRAALEAGRSLEEFAV
jgi:DNA-binding protein H-NS